MDTAPLKSFTIDGKTFFHNTSNDLMNVIYDEVWKTEEYKLALDEINKINKN